MRRRSSRPATVREQWTCTIAPAYHSWATVLVINLLLGWTAAGWLVALILALRRAAPSIQVIGQVNGQLPITRQKTSTDV